MECIQAAIRNQPPPPCPSVYGMIPFRITIVALALIFAVFFVWDSRSSRHLGK